MAALVGVASLAGWRGMPGNGAYCASKGALIRYQESLRAELRGSGVRVHTVSPGYLRTPLTAGNRFAMPGLMEADAAAQALLAAVVAGREHIVLPRHMGWLSKALGLLPAALHDRILLGQPRKPRVGEAGVHRHTGPAAAPLIRCPNQQRYQRETRWQTNPSSRRYPRQHRPDRCRPQRPGRRPQPAKTGFGLSRL